MGIVENYLQSKYSSGGPGSSRFEPVDDEVHASHISDCQRKRKWKHDRGHSSDPSPYFELGRVFELLYGAALAHEHDPSITAETLKDNQPWEVAEMSDLVVQDVNVEIPIGDGGRIVGECDWVVFNGGWRESYGHPVEVRVEEDGSRTALFDTGDGTVYDSDWTEKVVETKTKKNVEWVQRGGPDEKHIYQVYPYMHALDVNGEIAYMQRNDWEEHVVPLEYDPTMWLDSAARAREHARNQRRDDGVAPATPLNESACRWCPFREDCLKHGGSEYI